MKDYYDRLLSLLWWTQVTWRCTVLLSLVQVLGIGIMYIITGSPAYSVMKFLAGTAGIGIISWLLAEKLLPHLLAKNIVETLRRDNPSMLQPEDR